jgi:hypothetical protein
LTESFDLYFVTHLYQHGLHQETHAVSKLNVATVFNDVLMMQLLQDLGFVTNLGVVFLRTGDFENVFLSGALDE